MSRILPFALVLASLAVLLAGAWLFVGGDDADAAVHSPDSEAAGSLQNALFGIDQRDPSDATPISASAFRKKTLVAVKGAVVGLVVDMDGTPVVGAQVGLHEFIGKEPVLNTVLRIASSMQVDDQGHFEIPCPEFPSALVVEADGFLPELRVPVTAGDVVRLILRAGARHEFLVVDAVSGVGLPGVELKLTRGQKLPPCQLITGPDGRAHADTLLPGSQILAALAPRHLDQHDLKLQVEATRTATTELRLERGKSVSGVVSSQTTNTPVAGAKVSFLHKSSLTDAEGRYAIAGLPPIHVNIRVLARGYFVSERGVLLAGSRASACADFLLAPAASITGLVLDDVGRPLRGALVLPMSFESNSRNQRYDQDFQSYAVFTGEDGRFSLGGFSFGEAMLGSVLVECPPWLPTTSAQIALSQEGTCGDVTVRMARPDLVLRGCVTDVEGNPVGNAEVHIVHSHRMSAHREGEADVLPLQRRTITGADGCFAFVNLPPGSGSVECSHAGSRTREHYNLWPRKLPDALKLVLREVQNLTVVCRDDQGTCIAGAAVTFYGRETNMTESGLSGVDGRLQLRVSRNGPYRVRATAPGCKDLRLRDLMPDPDGVIALKFTRSSWIEFVLREKGTERIPSSIRLASQVKSETQLDTGSVHPDRETGTVRLAVPSGPQTLVLRAPGMLGCVRDVDVPTAATLDLGRIELEAGVSADGYVRLRDGRPVRGARLAFRPQARAADIHFRHLVSSSQDGWFHTTGLASGLHEVAVESEFAPLTIFPAVEISVSSGKGLELVLQPESATHLRVPSEWLSARLKTTANNPDAIKTNLSNNYSEFFSSRGSALRFVLTNKDHKPLALVAGVEDREFGPGWVASSERQIPLWGSQADLWLRNLPRGPHHLTLLRANSALFERDFENVLGETTVVEPARDPARN